MAARKGKGPGFAISTIVVNSVQNIGAGTISCKGGFDAAVKGVKGNLS